MKKRNEEAKIKQLHYSIQHISVRATDYTVLSTKSISRTRKVDAKFAKKETVKIRKELTLDRELLAVYNSPKFFRHVDEDKKLTIKTSHTPLIYAFRQRADKKPTLRQVTQLDFISQFSSYTCMAAELKITSVLRMNFQCSKIHPPKKPLPEKDRNVKDLNGVSKKVLTDQNANFTGTLTRIVARIFNI
ncbi:hypothetical protein HZH68_016154 [Vespula germanica]|uniref:Uncharacterized protein n=1 Tax=Vespula germanica TaxID=30212 RepID=A0A834J3Z0_VESGE|nr:hypothetical protein HZH68_016154 [Vespula germanica]